MNAKSTAKAWKLVRSQVKTRRLRRRAAAFERWKLMDLTLRVRAARGLRGEFQWIEPREGEGKSGV